jgi:RimJ/RimL family protein N-acetyltransferase
MTCAPTITGTSLSLRPHRIDDLDPLWAFYRSPRAQMMDVPEDRTAMWYGFAAEHGSWGLCGMGSWAIDVGGALAGQVTLLHPPQFAEPELGWLLLDGFEGKGLAYEAADLALRYARTTIRPGTLVSYIDPDNSRSIALARRLGATLDATAPRHDATDLVYRHRIAA